MAIIEKNPSIDDLLEDVVLLTTHEQSNLLSTAANLLKDATMLQTYRDRIERALNALRIMVSIPVDPIAGVPSTMTEPLPRGVIDDVLGAIDRLRAQADSAHRVIQRSVTSPLHLYQTEVSHERRLSVLTWARTEQDADRAADDEIVMIDDDAWEVTNEDTRTEVTDIASVIER